MPGINIRTFPLGPFGTNAYVITAADSADCWVIDPGLGPEPLLQHLKDQSLTPEAIILTHAHMDHIGGLAQVLHHYPNTPILAHPAEQTWFTDPSLNLSASHGMPMTAPEPTRLITEKDTLTLNSEPFRILHTPGHSPGSITLVHDASNTAIVGDTLFAGSIGRSDFPTSNQADLYDSIRTQLYGLPDETIVHPGHGPSTTIGNEKRTNQFVRAS